jgi:hypothetical protein
MPVYKIQCQSGYDFHAQEDFESICAQLNLVNVKVLSHELADADNDGTDDTLFFNIAFKCKRYLTTAELEEFEIDGQPQPKFYRLTSVITPGTGERPATPDGPPMSLIELLDANDKINCASLTHERTDGIETVRVVMPTATLVYQPV